MMVYIVFALFSFLLVGIGLFVLFGNKGKKSKNASAKYTKKNNMSVYNALFYRLDRIFITRNGFRKVYERLSELSIYGPEDTKVLAVRFYMISTVVFISVIIAGAVIFNEVFSTILCIVFAFVVKHIVVDKQLDNIHFKLLKQLSVAISSLRLNFIRYNSISEAIAETEVGSLIKRSFEEIYLILTSTNDEIRLEEFYASTPFKLLQTLAGVCYKINASGDVRLYDGTSNFVQAMSMMSSEINLEIRRISLQRARFGILEILPLAPIAAVGIIERYFSSIIPGTSIVYHGALGYITRMLIIFSAMAGYTVIVKVNSVVTIRPDDRPDWVKSLLGIPGFKKFIQDILPKKSIKVFKKTRLLRNALSRCDINFLYTKKVVFASIALAVSIPAAMFIVSLSREFTYTNVAELSLIGGENLSSADIEIRKNMDIEYLSGEKMTDRRTAQFVEKHIPKMQEYDKQAQVKRLQMKYDLYYGTYFKWWMLLICYMIAAGAWFAPEFMLIARRWFIKTEMEEDVLQLQTMIAILMNTTCDTLDILYWLERQSRVHKTALLEAYHEYPSNPELALNRLKAKGPLVDFKRMVDKLILTIHQISVAEAFGDLITERDHILRIREIAQVAAVNKKRQAVSPLSMIPLGITALGYILLPLGILGFQEFAKAMGQMGLK